MERIEAGAAWLDRTDPTWLDRINVSKLNLRDGCLCVLGQVVGKLNPELSYGDVAGDPEYAGYPYTRPEQTLADVRADVPRGFKKYAMTHSQAMARGFHAGDTRDWGRLNAAWKRYIKARRAAGA